MMETLMESVRDAADTAARASRGQDHEESLRVLEAMRLLLDQAVEYQKLKQSKLEAYLHG